VNHDPNQSGIDQELLLDMYRIMVLIRRFEEKIIDVYGAQDMKTPVHLCIGQEAVAAGVCSILGRKDYLFTNHRGHGHCLAKGMTPLNLYREFYGRIGGCSGAKGGSMHPVDPDAGILGTSAIVGGGIPLAVGAALAAKMQQNGRIAVVFFGDGATEEGVFHESLLFASLKRLPVIFVCENNFYAVNSHISSRQSNDNIVRFADAHGIPGVQVDGTDVLAVHKAARAAVDRARTGGGPTLLECRLYRWQGHVGPECDYLKGCRPKEELEQWMERCPVKEFRRNLLDWRLTTQDHLESLERKIEDTLEAALNLAKQSPFPAGEEASTGVYRESC
jgi:pyruvate dehydrogenase E1 component alpha subunit